jgi:UDP-N-acetylmuramyl pentapeptide phosphotransferase/UDP-N-acetylglucosamine-1-phosphate transferase
MSAWHANLMIAVLALMYVAAAAVAFALGVSERVPAFQRPPWRKQNFRGEPIPCSVGILFPLVGMTVSFGFGYHTRSAAFVSAATFFWGAAAFGFLGLIDDLLGSRETSGFKGHLGKLLRERKLTTGALKALGGGAAALALGYFIAQRQVAEGLLNGLLIALSANTLNLLDVRPSRALKGFFLLTALMLTIALTRNAGQYDEHAHTPILPYAPTLFLLPLILAALLYAPFDFRAKAMMGDVGSNSLGGIAGLYAAWTLPLGGKVALALTFAALHLLSERVSLTQIIERNRVLRFLDRVGVK